MKRIKVSDNFYLDEFIDPVTYNKFGYKSQRYIRQEVINIAQLLRDFTGLSITINNWATGGAYKESGLRNFTTSTGATYSAHKFGAAADLKIGQLNSFEMADIVIDNYEIFKGAGLTRIEDAKYTIGKSRSWLHFDVLWTGQDELQIIKP
jgi:hypothetical protein